MLKFAANYCRFWVIDYYNISPLPHSTLSSKRKLYLLRLTLPSHQLLCISSKLDFNTRSVLFEPLSVPRRCDYSCFFGFCMLWIFDWCVWIFDTNIANLSRADTWVANFPTVIHQLPPKELKEGKTLQAGSFVCYFWCFALNFVVGSSFIGNGGAPTNNSDRKNNS